MKFFGLLGEHLTHSLSEPIHRILFRITGIEGAYKLIEVAPDKLGDVCEAARLIGFSGLNVTIPYKQAVMAYLSGISDSARRIGAVNTVDIREGGMTGYNTDADGFSMLLEKYGVAVSGKTAALLGGSGGAARAIAQALLDGGAETLYLVSRSPQGKDCPDERVRWIDYDALRDVHGAVLVNATPVGMKPHADASPVDETIIAKWDAVVDAIYNPEKTRLLQMAEAQGKASANGLYMLVAQAVRAQEIWQDRTLGQDLTDGVYKALQREIAEGSVCL